VDFARSRIFILGKERMVMIQKQLIVGLAPGLESKIASQFVQKASSFSSDVFLIKNEKRWWQKASWALWPLPFGKEIPLH
jgi:phosphotransferase system HPr-like phosphotransfer protein